MKVKKVKKNDETTLQCSEQICEHLLAYEILSSQVVLLDPSLIGCYAVSTAVNTA
jgi:hypothetical protein